MPHGDLSEWRSRFVGRGGLLARLQDAYDTAADGIPQFVILLGPTGIGKTRLAQELYRWLTRERDPVSDEFPQGYWPDSFATEQTAYQVNPTFDDRPRRDIPWLWWGLRFFEPTRAGDGATAEGRRLDEGDALFTALKFLTPHTIQAMVKRNVGGIHGSWLWRLFSFGFGFVPGVGNLPGWIKDGWDTWRERGQRASLREQAGESVAATGDRQRQENADLALDALRQFLDAEEIHAPTIPVVLFLDDAQWIDRTALALVHRLWLKAHREEWPLLVVATHWDDEWEKHREASPAPGASPARLADFLACLAPEPRDGIIPLPVHPVADDALRSWVRLALPGATAGQLDLLLEKARAASWPDPETGREQHGGSPRVLEQIVLAVRGQPRRYFEKGDVAGPLTAAACDWIREEGHNLNAIVRRRFDGLDWEVQQVLGWSSLQGRRFLAEITRAVAAKVAGTISIDDPHKHLRRGERPHLWIQRVAQPEGDPGRFNLCEFRQAVFHEVAREHFTIDDAERAALDAAVSEVVAEWLDSGRLDPDAVLAEPSPDGPAPDPDRLTAEELRDALRIAVARFRPDAGAERDDARWSLYGHALARLAQLEARTYFWDQAEAVAIEFADARRPPGWPLGLVPHYWQIEVVDILRAMRERDRARAILEPLAAELASRPSSEDPDGWREVALVHERLGGILLDSGDRVGALDHFRESLGLGKRNAERFGESPQSLRDVSVSLEKVGDVELAEGRRAEALVLYRESLDLRKRIAERFGESPQSLRDLGVSEYRMAQVEPEAAVAWLTLACEHLGRIVERGWATPANREELAMLQSMLDEARGGLEDDEAGEATAGDGG